MTCSPLEKFKIAPFGTCVIEDQDSGGVNLVPLSRDCLQGNGHVDRLSAWREANREAFRSVFPVTRAGTRKWLTGIMYEQTNRGLFYVRNPQGKLFGLLGVSGLNADKSRSFVESVMRAPDATGSMAEGLRLLLRWLHRDVGIRDVELFVFHDQLPALILYYRCGFEPYSLVPLIERRTAESREWITAAADDTIHRFYLAMRHRQCED